MTEQVGLIPVSVVVPTMNEELAIEGCLRRLMDFEQVVVVDSASVDRTQELARARGAEVVDFRWNRLYPKKKQWCLDNLDLRHEWVLFVDADEYPETELVEEIRAVVANAPASVAAYEAGLAYYFMGVELKHGHTVHKVVLVRRSRVTFPDVGDLDLPGMNEQEGHYQPVADGEVRPLRGRMGHDDPGTLSEWVQRHNRYSDWEAGLVLNPAVGRKVNRLRTAQGRWFQKAPLKAIAFPFWALVVRGGWRDGRVGVDYAVALGFYYWLIGAKVRQQRLR